MFAAPPELVGKRVLIVEDEMLVALMIEDLLQELGCNTVGPCGNVRTALEIARTEPLDLAVLDVNLDGEKVYPVAMLLTERNIPFLFVSGYGDEAIPHDHSAWKVCTKPFRGDDLAAMLSEALMSVVD
jgi:CheY-like chemotaxis protein